MILTGPWKLRKQPARVRRRWLLPGIGAWPIAWIGGNLLPKALFMEEVRGFNLATVGIMLATIWQYSGHTMALLALVYLLPHR
jgi:glucose/mannose transport system permease protein